MAEKEVGVKAEKKSDKIDKKAKDTKKTDSKKNKKPNIFSRIAKYFRECKAEIKKITWPTPKSVFKNCGIVLVIIIVMGLLIFGLDRGLFALLNLVMETSAG
ncbi:MAG: preprotein translocase subunit SecE [Clostridia bacterium]|nr:preprotein translocase subunit SecE [Clostridia bacterium]